MFPLALLRRKDVFVPLGIDEAVQAVLLREAIRDARPMFPSTPSEIGSGTDIGWS